MKMLRGLVAVVVGYLFMVATVMVGTIVATAVFIPGGLRGAMTAPESLPVAYLAANLVASAFGAVVGGWLAARIAGVAPFVHAVALAAVVAVLSIMLAMTAQAGAQPSWYGPFVTIIGVAGVLLGGWLRATVARAAGSTRGC